MEMWLGISIGKRIRIDEEIRASIGAGIGIVIAIWMGMANAIVAILPETDRAVQGPDGLRPNGPG